MQCSKTFSIEIEEAVPILFSWPAAGIFPDCGSAAFTPFMADGNTVDMECQNPGGCSPNCDNTGTAIWNSTSTVNANMHIEVTGTGAVGAPDVWRIIVDVLAPFSNLVLEGEFSIGYNGIADIPFVLPDTGGANWTIEWQANVALFNALAETLTVQATLTIV